MKVIPQLKSTVKRLKQKLDYLKDPKNRKNLKIIAWCRNCHAWSLRFDHRLQQHSTVGSFDETERKCINCGHRYEGRICPQCGQAGTWSRYTWKQAILNFLDIWGLGNRPMFRTLRELFWRPGYMIRDYLDGHRQFYFPPFKLVAVVVVLLVFVGWLTGTHGFSPLSTFSEFMGFNEAKDWSGINSIVESKLAKSNFSVSDSLLPVISTLAWFIWTLSKNLLYEWLFIGSMAVICIWIAFKNVNRYNFVETYIFLTYVLALFLLCLIPASLLYRLNVSLETVNPFLCRCARYVYVVYMLGVCYLLVVAVRQFFGLTWISTLLRLLLSMLVGITLLIIAGVSIMSVLSNEADAIWTLIGLIIQFLLIVQGFSFAGRILKENRDSVSRAVINGCKVAMLSTLWTFTVGFSFESTFLNFIVLVFSSVLYLLLSVSLSLLPVFVYKKYQNTMIALLSLLPVAILVFVMTLWF